MPRKREHSQRYADALAALATVTRRSTAVVNHGDDYAIRVDFVFGRYLLATNTDAGLSDDPDSESWWTVRFFDSSGDGADPSSGTTAIAEARAEWLADAFDDAVATLRAAGNWTDSATAGAEP